MTLLKFPASFQCRSWASAMIAHVVGFLPSTWEAIMSSWLLDLAYSSPGHRQPFVEQTRDGDSFSFTVSFSETFFKFMENRIISCLFWCKTMYSFHKIFEKIISVNFLKTPCMFLLTYSQST